MGAILQQTVIVDNRPSAGSIVGSSLVAHSPPDGHTLLLLSNANAVSVSLFRKLPFDVQRDFAPISTLGYFDLAVFVGASSPFRQLKDLLAAARARPKALTVATITPGSTQHLAAELFKSRAGIELLTVPYRGTPAVLTALRAGEADVAFEILGPMLSQMKAGAVRALAVTSERRFPLMPEVPTVVEAGVPGYAVASWNALAAPAGTPAPVLAQIGAAVRRALEQPALHQQLEALGVRAQASTPAELQTLLTSEIARWAAVVRSAKIEPE
jgi:tripartite-type tricarboxylate transporter receptor subunit TctC